MITLTDEGGKTILINPDHIVAVFTDSYRNVNRSNILLSHTNIPQILVKEDQDTIQQKINDLYE